MGPADSFRTVRGLAFSPPSEGKYPTSNTCAETPELTLSQAVNGAWLPLTTRCNQQLHHAQLGRVRGGQDQGRNKNKMESKLEPFPTHLQQC